MTEILTESFCERCGSRYTFESSAPRRSRVGRIKVFSKGIRNFVMTDESSFSEAMADARSEEELVATVHQLDAFHKTFNFCLGCRQYTCGPCWNPGESRCLTCAPDPALEAAEAPTEPAAEAPVGHAPAAEAPAAVPGDTIAAEVWPDSDVPAERLARAVGAPSAIDAEAEADAAAAAMVDAQLEAEAVVQADAEAVVQADAEATARMETLERAEVQAAEVQAAEAASAPAPASVQGVAPGQTLEEAIAAWEARQLPERIPVEAAVEPEPVAASAPEPVPHAEDIVPQPTWPAAATQAQPPTPTVPTEPVPDAPAPWLTVAPDDSPPEPQWPTTPIWPQAGPRRHTPATIAGRPLLPQGDVAALWAASAREVLSGAPASLSAAPASLPAAAAALTAQPCVDCGLSLSANARFCRRCGTRQP